MAYVPPQAINGPQADTDYLAALVATRNSVAQELAQESAAIANTGNARATYSLGNRQVQWNEYRKAMMDHLADLNKMIQELDIPYEIQVHGWV
jgi:hypothetical protein